MCALAKTDMSSSRVMVNATTATNAHAITANNAKAIARLPAWGRRGVVSGTAPYEVSGAFSTIHEKEIEADQN